MKLVPRAIWFSILLVFIVGCRGCSSGTAPAPPVDPALAKKNAKIETDDLRSLPYSSDTVGVYLKPGHWYQANQKLTSNSKDESLVASVSIYDRDRRLVPMFPGYSPVSFQRQLSLARSQSKNIRFQFYQPDVPITNAGELDQSAVTKPAHIEVYFADRSRGIDLFADEFPTRLLNGYQYNIVTFNSEPSRYLFWRALPCLNWPSVARLPNERVVPHRVYDLSNDEIAGQFPNRLFAMTSISHVVFNDTSPALLSSEQQEALLDWLHFGGTVIINGPDANAGIQSSFFKRFTPLVQASTIPWDESKSAQLNQFWSISQLHGTLTTFQADPALTMLEGDLTEGASWVPKLEGLVAERFVGQGRVVMTTFPMSANSFLKWPSYDSLIHNGILRKPNRTVVGAPEYDTVFAGDFTGTELNPVHSTRLRIWGRDLDASMTTNQNPLANAESKSIGAAKFPSMKRTSLGAWNPDSELSKSARTSLEETSGITVPKIQTVLKLLTGYLIVLVPLNWGLFRLFRRTELAWVAAPLIAVVGAVVVARSVQLDVGFTRSHNTYSLLECHPNYSRGVTTSYHSLYTSLSTTYQATFDNDQGIVSPLATLRDNSRNAQRIIKHQFQYTYAEPTGNGLRNNAVLSNTTGMLQSEEIFELDGTYQTELDPSSQKLTWTNELSIPVYDIGVLGVDTNGVFRTGWIGSLDESESVDVDLAIQETGERWIKNWDRNKLLKRPDFLREDGSKWTEAENEDGLYLGAMLESIATQYPFGQGEYIAIGWTDAKTTNLHVEPEASQNKHTSLVMMHVTPAALPSWVTPDTAIFPKIESTDEEQNGDR